MAQGTVTPPPGFKLDSAPAQTVIQPPPGFKLDQQQSALAGASAPSKSPQAPKSWLSPSDDWQGIKNFASQSPLGLLAHPINAAKTVAKTLVNPYDPGGIAGKVIEPIVQNARDQGKQAIDMAKQGSYGAAASHALLATPLVGQVMQQAMDQSNTGGDNSYGANLKNLISSPQSMGTLAGATAGYAAPELLKAAPAAASDVMGSAGDALQGSGAARYDRFLNGGKELPVGDNGLPEYYNPGRAVLENGPTTSVVSSRPQLTRNIAAARTAAGPDVAAAVQGSPARIPLPDLKNAVTGVMDPMRSTVKGPLGNPRMLGRLDEIQDSFGPSINYQGTASPTSVWDNLQIMDKNLNYNKGADAIEVTANNAGKQIRANTSRLLKNYVPEAVPPINRYADLSDALELSEKNQNIPAVKWNSLGRDAADVVMGAGTGLISRSPEAALAVGAATHTAPMLWKLPLTQTGLATGAYQLGKGMSRLGQYAGDAAPAVAVGVDSLPAPALRLLPSLAPKPSLAAPGNGIQNDKRGDDQQKGDPSQSVNQGSQITPPNGISSVTPLSLIPPPLSPLSAAIPLPQSNALAIPGRRLSWGNAA